MPRITLESLMAPGGVLDAGSRLVTTLYETPFKREMFRAGLQEKAEGIKREDERIAKTDKVGYLTNRIATVQQRIKELRHAMQVGDVTEARVLAAQLKKSGAGIGGEAGKAIQDGLKAVADREAEIRKQNDTKVGKGLATAQSEEAINAEVEKYRAGVFKRIKDQYPEAFAQAAGGLDPSALGAIKADPQLQRELDIQLDQQDQLFDQYRRLVGQTEDIAAVDHFLLKNTPEGAKPAPKGLDPAAFGQHPDDLHPPEMPTVRTADQPGAAKGLAAATAGLDDPNAVKTLLEMPGYAQGLNSPAVQEQAAQLRLPGIAAARTKFQEHREGRLAQGKDTMQVDDSISKNQDIGRGLVAVKLAQEVFGAATPENIAKVQQMLATVHPAGIDMAVQELANPPTQVQPPIQMPTYLMAPVAPPRSILRDQLIPRLQGGLPLAQPRLSMPAP